MNKTAVALAADSALTVGRGERIYTSVSKLFALSKYEPVGVMIYDNAQIMGVPWETVIKTFRSELGSTQLPTLRAYADRLVDYLLQGPLFPEELQLQNFRDNLSYHFLNLRWSIDEQLMTILGKNHRVLKRQASKVARNTIEDDYHQWREANPLEDLPKAFAKAFLAKYGKLVSELVDEAKEQVFGDFSLCKRSVFRLRKIAEFYGLKSRFVAPTGLVVAGFGRDEHFPSLCHCTVECVVNGHLKRSPWEVIKVTHDCGATIAPFAQKDMVALFMNGVSRYFTEMVQTAVTDIIERYPAVIVDAMPNLTVEEKQKTKKKLEPLSKPIIDQLFARFKAGMEKNYTPIVQSVVHLPKDELAAMAESLVSLTSFKHRVTARGNETVGGPIDVAVISKGDGFIWIKRKHYFPGELNLQFFANYLRQSTKDEEGAGSAE